MKKIHRICKDGNTERLLALLKGRVFHRTTAEAFASIKRAGTILHNGDKSLGTNTGSKSCFGGVHRLVRLLNLRDHDQETLKETEFQYPFLDPHLFEKTRYDWMVSKVVYLLLQQGYYH